MVRLSPLSRMCFLLISGVTQAQIPNPGFENWTGTEPDGWATGNLGGISLFPITRSTDAHSGSYSLNGTIVAIPGSSLAMSAAIQSGSGGNGFAVNARHAAVTGYYKCSLLSGDKLGFNFGMFQGGAGIAGGAQFVPTNASTWTAFSVPFGYFASGNPDNCTLQFQIIGPTTGSDFHIGSWYELDDLALTNPTGILPDTKPATYSLGQNFPNPFNPSTTIRYSLAHTSKVTLSVFNTLGKRVATLVNESEEAGYHDVRFDASELSSGVYFYRLQAGSFIQTKRFVILR